jgi:hypothetical protein
MPSGIVTFIVGLVRYRKIKNLIQELKEDNPAKPNTE